MNDRDDGREQRRDVVQFVITSGRQAERRQPALHGPEVRDAAGGQIEEVADRDRADHRHAARPGSSC